MRHKMQRWVRLERASRGNAVQETDLAMCELRRTVPRCMYRAIHVTQSTPVADFAVRYCGFVDFLKLPCHEPGRK